MITVAAAAVALALISAQWNSPLIIDPFDNLEMVGPSQIPSRGWNGNECEKGAESLFPTTPACDFSSKFSFA